MSIINNTLLLGSGDEGYNLTRSLRFRASASAYLNRTPASATNRKTYTWSGWVKRGILSSSTRYTFFASSSGGANNFTSFSFDSDNIRMLSYNGGSKVLDRASTPVYRDPSAWYHIVVAVDMTQATATNRQRVYVNNVEITAWTNTTTLSQNSDTWINYNQAHYIARDVDVSTYFDGYATEVNFIDGSQLTPSSFGETDTITGVWKPKRYAGTYGTNGFYLPFTDNSALTTSSNAGLGKDFSGNGNYWTTNNISITSGVTYDSMTDVPTLTSATASNFAVLNPLDRANSNLVTSNANMVCTNTGGTGNAQIRASIALPSTGKFYWETKNTGSANNFSMGLSTLIANLSTEGAGDVLYNENGVINNNGTTTSGFATLALNDVVGVAVDIDANKIYWYKNNTLVNSGGTTINISAPFAPMFGFYTTNNAQSVNFGQQPFTYTPPSGYVALNTYNLPTPTIVKGNTVMDATTYTGTGATLSVTNAAGFKPDLVWIKARNAAFSNVLADSVRGVTKYLYSDQTVAEDTVTDRLTSFNSNGFTTGGNASTNRNADSLVAWQWQAGQGSSSSNTAGSITSTVSVNASAGFSVVTYTGTNVSGATIGHGLGVAPSLIIIKNRTSVEAWPVYHRSVGATKYLVLNTTAAEATSSTPWNNTAPTSTVFSLGNWNALNENGSNHVAYCWTPIAGYSAFGSYTGNGSSDGVFVYTGFQPKWVMVKKTSGADDWVLFDATRSPYNVVNNWLLPNTSGAELTSAGSPDLLSNGFKMRSTSGATNASGATYIYVAFATCPFQNSLAR